MDAQSGIGIFLESQPPYIESLRTQGFGTKYLKRTESVFGEFHSFLEETNCNCPSEIYTRSRIRRFIEWKQLNHQKNPHGKHQLHKISRPISMFLKWKRSKSDENRINTAKVAASVDEFLESVSWQFLGKPEKVRSQILEFFSYLKRHEIRHYASISKKEVLHFSSETVAQYGPRKPYGEGLVEKLTFDLDRYFHHLDKNGLISYIRDIPVGKLPRRHFMSGVIQAYTDFCREGRGLSATTLKANRSQLNMLANHLEKLQVRELAKIESHHIESFVASRDWSVHSIQGLYSLLRRFLKYLYVEKLIPRDLSKLLISPRLFSMAKIPKCLNQEELKRLLEEKSSPVESVELCTRAIVYLMLFTGMRSKEVARLKLDDLNWDKKQILISKRKNGQDHLQVLPEIVIQAIYAYVSQFRPNHIEERNLFFTIRVPLAPMKSSAVRSAVYQHFRVRGIRGGAHRLRHTHAQLLLESGSSLDQVQASLGHLDENSTRIYTKTSMSRMRKYVVGEET